MAGPPEFHGYGYNAWMGGPGSGLNPHSRPGFGTLHPTASVSQFVTPKAQSKAGPSINMRLPNWGGQIGASELDPTGGINWGAGRALVGSMAQSLKKLPLGRSQAFSSAQGNDDEQLALGPGAGPSGALGAGSQPPGAIGAAPPNAIGSTYTLGELPRARPMAPGPVVMPSGPRPQGPAPTPLAIGPMGAPGGSTAPRSRSKAFGGTVGQMQFGEIP